MVGAHLLEASRTGKAVGQNTDRWLPGAGGGEQGEASSDFSWVQFPAGGVDMFWNQIEERVVQQYSLQSD